MLWKSVTVKYGLYYIMMSATLDFKMGVTNTKLVPGILIPGPDKRKAAREDCNHILKWKEEETCSEVPV